MKLYLARHGLTDWNIAHKAQGHPDIPLNAIGIKQAEDLGNKIKDLQFDAVYASPLQRAVKTAEIATRQKYTIIIDHRLIERSFGDFEGKKVNGWLEATGHDIGDLRLNTAVGGIEPVKDVLARTKSFLDDLKYHYSDDAAILVVAHGQVIRALHHNIIGYTDDTDWWSVNFDNAEIRSYDV